MQGHRTLGHPKYIRGMNQQSKLMLNGDDSRLILYKLVCNLWCAYSAATATMNEQAPTR